MAAATAVTFAITVNACRENIQRASRPNVGSSSPLTWFSPRAI